MISLRVKNANNYKINYETSFLQRLMAHLFDSGVYQKFYTDLAI